MENWRGYLNEESDDDLTLVQDFIKSLMVIVDAADDADKTQGLKETGQRFNRRRKKDLIKKIKQRSGLSGIKMEDFTQEQKNLYKDTKRELQHEEAVATFKIFDTIANGDILKIPLVKNLAAKGGQPLKFAIAAIAGEECSENLSLNCLTSAVYRQMQLTGKT